MAKNYLAEAEARELNRLTTILLDIFEDQAEVGRLTLMSQATQLFDSQLKTLGRGLLQSGGSVSTAAGKKHAEREYEKFKAQQRRLRHEQADKAIAAIKADQKSLRGKK